ncbi:MAG: peptidylprolyl isomerase [Bacteroidales bacterium]|nr:peptidylprolyl isomerase [Bacteroidales bacterium]
MKTDNKPNPILLLLFLLMIVPGSLLAQIIGQQDPVIIDRVIAVVGRHPVYQSDLEDQIRQLRSQGVEFAEDPKCEVLESLLISKLLVSQSEIDSIEVADDEVRREVDNRIKSMMAYYQGDEQMLETMFNKKMVEITQDMFKPMKEQLIVRRMQQEIYNKLEVTPSEVQKFFRKIPENEIPLRPESMEIREIALKPKTSDAEIARIQARLLEFRERIQNGERMSTLAALYSEDPGTAPRGGEVGLVLRNNLAPEFFATAMNLKPGEVSRIVKTEFGYHIIQLIERRGDLINCRHILLIPKPSLEEQEKTSQRLDSIAQIIREGKIKFEQAATLFSEEKNTSNNGGLMVNLAQSQNYNTTWFEPQELPKEVLDAVRNLKVGEISSVFSSIDSKNNLVYKIVSIKTRRPAHRADLKQDYQYIQSLALQEKQEKTLSEWVSKRQKTMFIRIDPDFRGCQFENDGWIK